MLLQSLVEELSRAFGGGKDGFEVPFKDFLNLVYGV